MRVNFSCRWRRTSGVGLERDRARAQQIGEVERAGRGLERLVPRRRARPAPAAGSAARSASASLLELLQVGEERVARREHLGARRRRRRTCSRCPSACATKPRSRTRSTSRASHHRDRAGRTTARAESAGSAGARASVSTNRLSRSDAGAGGQIGERVQRRDEAVDLARRDRTAAAATARESRAIRPACRPAPAQPIDRAVAVAAAERRRARPPQRAAHAFRRLLQRLLEPVAERARRTAASACGSVSTANSGSTRASTGRSRSSSAQKPWIVLTCASSSVSSACSSRALTSA